MIRNKLHSFLLCLLFGLAISSPKLAADTLIVNGAPLIPVNNSNGTFLFGSFSSMSADWGILSNTALAQPTQGYGTYTDMVGQTFTAFRPGAHLNLAFGSYAFLPGAPLHTEVTGVTLSLFYTLYSADPNSPSFDPIADYVSNDQVSVSNIILEDEQSNAGPPLQAPAPVPEPGSSALAAAGLLLLSYSMLRKRA